MKVNKEEPMYIRKKLIAAAVAGLSLISAPELAQAALQWTSSGPGGGGAFAGAAVSSGGTNVFVPSDLGGIYWSTNSGVSWTAIGKSNGLDTTHVDAVALHPSIDGTVFVGAQAGIYRSVNCTIVPAGICTFSKLNLPSSNPNTLVTAVATASAGTASATTVYAAGIDGWCNDGPHLWKSTDNGSNWIAATATGIPSNANIMAIRVQPGNANNIIAVSARSRFTGCGALSQFPVEAPNRAFKSIDGGNSFTPVWISTGVAQLLQSDSISTGSWAYIDDMKFDKANPSKIWATVSVNPSVANCWDANLGELWSSAGALGFANDFVWRSNGAIGQLWPLSTGNIRAIDLCRQNPWNGGVNGVWEFNATSNAWTRITTDNNYLNWGRGWFSEPAFVGQVNAPGLANGPGASLNGNLHTITPVDDTTLWWTDHQFAFKTIDGGHLFNQQFTNATSSVPVSYYSKKIDNAVPGVLAPSPLQPDTLYAGYFDMGCWRSQDASPTWSNPSWINCNGPKSIGPDYLPSNWNGGWKGYGGNTTAIAPDPAVLGTLWMVQSSINSAQGSANTYKIAKTVDSGVTLIDQTFDLNAVAKADNRAVTDLMVQATGSSRRLWAIANNRLFKLENGATSWTRVTTLCDTGGGLMVMAQKGTQMIVGGGSGVCRSTDSGATWPNPKWTPPWTGNSANTWWLEGQNINSVYTKYVGVTDFAFHPSNNQIAWMTVIVPNSGAIEPNAGLYKTINGGQTWAKVTTLPAVAAIGMNYARTVAVSPANANILVVGNSTALTSGGLSLPNNPTGAWVSSNGGATTLGWSSAPENAGLVYPFITRLRFTSSTIGGAAPRLWGISPGQGLVFSASP
jgi:hypothetical protein